MDVTGIMDVIKGPILTINEKFDQGTKNINDFMEDALKLCENVKKKLSEKKSLKTTSVKNNDMQFSTLIGKGLQMQKQAKFSALSVSSIYTDRESGINIMEDTIAARTRGAIKARDSKITVQVSTNITYETRTRGRNNKNTISDSSASTHKRSAEYEIEEDDCFKKKKLASPKTENDKKVFKKPKTRGRGKAVKNQETELVKSLDTTVEESQFFNAPTLFTSSPNIKRTSPRTSAIAALSPKQSTESNNLSPVDVNVQHLSKKSLHEEILAPSPVPTSNDNINEDKNTESDKDIPTVESNVSNTATHLEETLLRPSNGHKKRTGSLSNSPKLTTSKANESSVKSQAVEENIDTNSKKSNTPRNRHSRSVSASSEKTQLIDSPKPNATVVLEKSEKETQVPNCKSDEKSEKPVNVTRSLTSRQKVTQGNNSPDLMSSPSGKGISTAVGENLNSTKNVREASKRTKPVLKSKIFDGKGNILPGGSENVSVKKETAENTYSLRSSPRTDSSNSPAVKEKNKKETAEMKKTKNERSKRTRGKNAQKKPDVIDVTADKGKVTRTKTRKAKEEQENAGRKSGLTLQAKKSLNKAKILSLKKEKLKEIQALASRLTNQKGQNPMSAMKVHSHSKNHGNLLIVPCLKGTENLASTGKGKYLTVYNERANTLITPAKRGETGDSSIKSAAKIAKENEIDKELKLKALREKEEEAWVKREMAIKNRQKELKEKNEMKLQSAMKQRQKLETEKYNNILQSEKEKQAKSKLLLQEIEQKRREDLRKKKMEAEKKQAEAEERKRLKEEARKAREKEQEAERQRILMGKEKEMERHQKWAQERLADEQAREKYEIKLKEQLMKEKALSNKKPDKPSETTVTLWDYKSRNENDFGLEDEDSENDSMDEEQARPNRPIPKWAKRVLDKKCQTINFISQDMMAEYMTCHSKTPDIQKMFKMTPRKKIKRTSSAIWNTPSS